MSEEQQESEGTSRLRNAARQIMDALDYDAATATDGELASAILIGYWKLLGKCTAYERVLDKFGSRLP